MASDHSMPEVEAVIFAGGASSSMFPLTETIPKCALSVMGRPLINYQLAVLAAANVRTVHIITFADARSQLGLALDSFPQRGMNISIHTVPDTTGTAEALCEIREHIATDFLVLPCDLVSEDVVTGLLATHRAYGPAVSAVFKQEADERDGRGKPVKRSSITEYVGIAPEDNRLVHLSSSLLSDRAIALPKPLLRRRARVHVHQDLRDVHTYLFSHWVISLLDPDMGLVSLQADLVPFLLEQQFRGVAGLPESVRDSVRPALADAYALSLSTRGVAPGAGGNEEDAVKCYALVVPPTGAVCARLDSPTAFRLAHLSLLANRRRAGPAEGETEPDSLPMLPPVPVLRAKGSKDTAALGEVELGAKASLQKCVVGTGCSIGSKSKLNSCVLMDNVTVGDNCILQNTVICRGVTVGNHCNINDCQVAEGAAVRDGEEHKKAIIGRGSLDAGM